MDMNRVFNLNMSIGHANRRKRDMDAAIESFSKAIEISPDNPDNIKISYLIGIDALMRRKRRGQILMNPLLILKNHLT